MTPIKEEAGFPASYVGLLEGMLGSTRKKIPPKIIAMFEAGDTFSKATMNFGI